MSDSYALRCRGCRFLRIWREKTVYESDFRLPSTRAYMCVHPQRRHPARVNEEDRPFNPCASEGARSCPRKEER